MKSLLILLLLPLFVFADSESDEEVQNATDYICPLVLDDDIEVECKNCAEKAISEADITDTEERAKYESEALAILHSCSDHLPQEAANCVQEVDSISCLDHALQTKETNMLAEYVCKKVEPKEECLECVASTALDFVKSSKAAIKSIRTNEIAQGMAFNLYFQCLSHLSLQELDNLLSSESSE